MLYLQHVIATKAISFSLSLSTDMGQVIPSPVKLATEALGLLD